MKIESIEIIPSKPEGDTIFENPYKEIETFNITNNFDEWKNMCLYSCKRFNEENSKYGFDVLPRYTPSFQHNVIELFDGFMMGPVALYEGNALTAISKIINLSNFEEFKKELPTSDKRFLYMLHEENGIWKIRYSTYERD